MEHGDWKDLFFGVQRNNLDLVQIHLVNGVDLNYQHPEYMTSPLIESIRKNNLEIMIMLLQNGASPQITEVWSDKSPIMIATENNNLPAIAILQHYLLRL